MAEASPRPAGYSGTPLPKKLGLGDGDRVVAVGAPPQLDQLLDGRPLEHLGLEAGAALQGPAEVVLLFVTARAELEAWLPGAGRAVFPAGMVWVGWPKRASKVPTDVTEDVVREVALPLELVDTKVAAIDATWSGLRVVWRKERRTRPAP